MATVGKMGQPGEQVRCVVSVSMLTEGWDANSVTHILGLRAFGSQLLCEQVVGRGLRRMDYVPDPETGLLTEEYVDVYGIPFSVIPFKGKESNTPESDRPKNHVRARPERAGYEIRFPVVENYAFVLEKNLVRCDVAAMPRLEIEPHREPTATFLLPQVGYQEGRPSQHGPFSFVEQDRSAYYRDNHLQTIQFNVARLVVEELVGGATLLNGNGRRRDVMRLQGRHQLFPQVYAFVDRYVRTRVDFRGQNPCELGLEFYVRQLVERFAGADGAIVPDGGVGRAAADARAQPVPADRHDGPRRLQDDPSLPRHGAQPRRSGRPRRRAVGGRHGLPFRAGGDGPATSGVTFATITSAS